MMSSEWFRIIDRFAGSNPSPPELFWICHAGGGTAPLVRALSQLPATPFAFKFRACVLPGREDRFSQPRIESMPKLIENLTECILEKLSSNSTAPRILLGHSMGALIAYRLAQNLTLLGAPPAGLVAMAMKSPDRFQSRRERLKLSDADLADELDREFGGIPAVIRENPAAMQLFLPIVRSDLQLMETFVDPTFNDACLQSPIAAIYGSHDPAATEASMNGWHAVTCKTFSLHRIEGNHFFPIASIGKVLQIALGFIEPFESNASE